MKKESLKTMRANALYLNSMILHGNNKLKDFDDEKTGKKIRYAQFNTRAIKDCPFRSAGCEKVCYATKGNHCFPSVTESRERSYNDTKRKDFAEALIYTIKTEQKSSRYAGNMMLIRIHESGDFYSLRYLKEWVKIWEALENVDGVSFTDYTKSFRFFLMLSDEEAEVINRCLSSGKLTINLSMDDTTSKEQREAYLACLKRYPKMNTYYCTEEPESIKHDDICDCADCAQCGKCNHADGKTRVVKIHSASNADLVEYRKNITAEA